MGRRDPDGEWNMTEAEDPPFAEVLRGGRESFVARSQPSGTAARNPGLAEALSTSPLKESREELIDRVKDEAARAVKDLEPTQDSDGTRADYAAAFSLGELGGGAGSAIAREEEERRRREEKEREAKDKKEGR